MCEDPEVMRYLPGILTREQSEEQISKFVRHWKGRGFGLRAAEVRATGTFIGFIGLQYSEDWPEGEHKTEVGWPARPFLLGTWLATEARWRASATDSRSLGWSAYQHHAPGEHDLTPRDGEMRAALRGLTRCRGFDVIWYAKDRRDWEAEYKKLTAES